MKKIILVLLAAVAMTTHVYSERVVTPLKTHQPVSQSGNKNEDRNPINLPITVYYDSDTYLLEVWCQDDNIQGEIFVYDESGAYVIELVEEGIAVDSRKVAL